MKTVLMLTLTALIKLKSAWTTEVEGIPAILLEVVDIEDPILVGDVVTYEIKVTNQGSATGTGITVNCNLEPEMEFISGGELSGNTIALETLAELAPGATHTWTVQVKARAAGDVRFGVNMNSDQIGRDVTETESTNFYN